MYREHLACFTSQGYKKGDVYKKIASELQKQGFCYNCHQCDKKMRSLKYRYRLLLEGCDPSCQRRWHYYTLIDKLLANDPALKQKKGMLCSLQNVSFQIEQPLVLQHHQYHQIHQHQDHQHQHQQSPPNPNRSHNHLFHQLVSLLQKVEPRHSLHRSRQDLQRRI